MNRIFSVRMLSLSLLLLLLCPFTVGCGSSKPTTDGTTAAGTTAAIPDETTAEQEPTAPDMLNSYYYNQLSEEEQSLYRILLSHLERDENSVTIENTDYDRIVADIARVTAALYYDHPEFFYIKNAHEVNGSIYPGENDDTVTILLPSCALDVDLSSAKQRLEDAVDAIVAEAKKRLSPYEQVKFVHDYIIGHTVYDQENANLYNAELNSPSYALVGGRAVCGGYARSFQLIMDRLGIPSSTLAGSADGIPHAWNVVMLDGEYYLLDLTWDDTERDLVYAYFGLTSAELLLTHTPDPMFRHPTCTATKYNYYRYEGLLLDTYTFEAVYAIIERQTHLSRGYIKFTSEAVLNDAIKNLIEEHRWTELPGFGGAGSVSYLVDPNNLILYLVFPE